MKREILFRGKRTDNGEWVEGDLIHGVSIRTGKMYILPIVSNLECLEGCDPLDGYNVIPDSVGQFTGITDKNGIKIFEGDIIKWIDSDGNNRIDKVWYHNGGFVLCNIEHHIGNYIHNYLEVIGNIYDNINLINK